MPFVNQITEDGEFTPEANRYVLYVALGCPYAHRALLARTLKGLEHVIDVAVVHYLLGPEGWKFATPEDNLPDCTPDPVNNFSFMRQVYLLSDKDFEGRVTVPVLFDKKTQKIVNNESAEIVRIFSTAFNKLAKHPEVDFYPENLAPAINKLNAVLEEGFITAVYKAGYAPDQESYEKSARLVTDTLLHAEEVLKNSTSGWLVGDQLTETDIRLFVTALRYDPVYSGLYKLNLVRTKDLPNVLTWMKKIYALPGVSQTVNMEHIKKMYYISAKQFNPNGIYPISNGPLFD